MSLLKTLQGSFQLTGEIPQWSITDLHDPGSLHLTLIFPYFLLFESGWSHTVLLALSQSTEMLDHQLTLHMQRYSCLECLPHWGACACLLSLINEVFLTHPFFPGSPIHISLVVPNHSRIRITYSSPLLDEEVIKCISSSISFWKRVCLTHQRHSVCCHHYRVCLTSGLEQ